MRRFAPALLWALGVALATTGLPAAAITIDPYYAGSYAATDLGSVPGVPPLYGGLTFKFDDPNVIIIGGNANDVPGAIYAISVIRDAGSHVVGFSGTAAYFADAAYNDGGVTYGPGHVLFLARWPVDQLGQTRPGSSVTDKIIDLAPFGVESSSSALNFVPPDFPGAGNFKLVTWEGGQWNDVSIAPDGSGTYDVTSVTEVPASRLPGGPEGFVFVPLGSPLFAAPSLLVSEYSAGRVASYELDAAGDPNVATRRDFVTDLTGAEGAAIDPLNGDFLFSTFGGGDRVIVVQGFVPPPPRGACCLTGELCTEHSADECQALNGVFKGAGSACANCICASCVGDCNCDGVIDFDDINPFVAALSGGQPCSFSNCDTNCDGVINFDDIDSLVELLSSGAVCPS